MSRRSFTECLCSWPTQCEFYGWQHDIFWASREECPAASHLEAHVAGMMMMVRKLHFAQTGDGKGKRGSVRESLPVRWQPGAPEPYRHLILFIVRRGYNSGFTIESGRPAGLPWSLWIYTSCDSDIGAKKRGTCGRWLISDLEAGASKIWLCAVDDSVAACCGSLWAL